MNEKIWIQNEWDTLNVVFLGNIKDYQGNKDYIKGKNIVKDIKHILENYNIQVLSPYYNKNIKIRQSFWVRDSATVIDDKLLLFPLLKPVRRNEYKTYKNISKNVMLLMPPVNTNKIEGGDILQHNNTIFVGLGNRTNQSGIIWLKKIFYYKTIISIKHTALHLDCCFCLLPNDKIVYSKKYINNLPNYCFEKYECVNIDNMIDGESNLATNLFFINKNTLLMSDNIKFKNFMQYLQDEGFVVLTITLDSIFKGKGGIRCIIQPLLRQ